MHSLPDEGTGRTVRPHLGGGTTLAARWGHRRSTDIDILLPGRNTLLDLAQDNDDNIARRLGGEPEAVSGARIKIAFSEGKIDLIWRSWETASASRLVHATPAGDLSNAQRVICRGIRAPIFHHMVKWVHEDHRRAGG